MDDKARLQLNKMINANDVVDQTELMRQLKHSHILRANVNTLIDLKCKYMSSPNATKDELDNSMELIKNDAIFECNFLFTYYTDIYNKILKDEIDLTTLFHFFDVLQKIEDGELDQHEGSYEVGVLLKKIYIDSALKKAKKLDDAQLHDDDSEVIDVPPKNISWSEYKNINKCT